LAVETEFRAMRKGTMTTIDCPSCRRNLKLPEGVEGKKAKCTHCGARFVIPEGTAPVELSAASASEVPDVASEPVGGPSDSDIRSTILLAVGGAFLVAAFFVNMNIDDKDGRQGRIDDALSSFRGAVSGNYGQAPSAAASRGPVYFLAAAGIAFIGLAIVSWQYAPPTSARKTHVEPSSVPLVTRQDAVDKANADRESQTLTPLEQATKFLIIVGVAGLVLAGIYMFINGR
jgi:LSD1 subclass zinc finger protein